MPAFATFYRATATKSRAKDVIPIGTSIYYTI